MECQSIRGLTTPIPWTFCGWTCFILESYLIYKICIICRINARDGVCKYFLKVVWIFLFSWVPVYIIDKERQLAVMSMGFMMPLHGEDQRKMVFILLCSLLTLTCSTLLAIVDLSDSSLVKLVWNHFKGVCCLILSPFLHKITFSLKHRKPKKMFSNLA